jgi:hypothetical protein
MEMTIAGNGNFPNTLPEHCRLKLQDPHTKCGQNGEKVSVALKKAGAT